MSPRRSSRRLPPKGDGGFVVAWAAGTTTPLLPRPSASAQRLGLNGYSQTVKEILVIAYGVFSGCGR
jgi:hypothetical protein